MVFRVKNTVLDEPTTKGITMFSLRIRRFAEDVKYAYDRNFKENYSSSLQETVDIYRLSADLLKKNDDFRRDVADMYRKLYYDLSRRLPESERVLIQAERDQRYADLVSKHYHK